MKIVFKGENDENELRVAYSLSEHESESIKHVFGYDLTSTYHHSRLAKKVIEKIHKDRQWILCDCSNTKKPLMYIRGYKDRLFTLVRMAKRDKHESCCPLSDTKQFNASINNSRSHKRISTKKLRLHGPLNINVSEKNPNQGSVLLRNGASRNKDSSPKMSRLLYTILDDANIVKVFPQRLTLKDQIMKIRNILSEYTLAPKIPMDRYTWFDLSHISIKKAEEKLIQADSIWPKSSRPHAIFIAFIDRVQDGFLYVINKSKEEKLKVHGHAYLSGRLGERSGPYLTIFSLVQLRKDKNEIGIYNPFIVPVYNQYLWIPVDSSYERRVLRHLLQIQHWYFKNQRITFEVLKPLFDIDVTNNKLDKERTFCRPDFILKENGRILNIEVMGFNDEEYFERKLRTHSLMKRQGPIFEFNADYAERTSSWDKESNKMWRWVSGWLLANKSNVDSKT